MRALSLGKSTSRVKNNREAIMHKPSKAALMIFSRSGTDSDQVVWVGEAVALLCIVARRANSCPHTRKSVIMWGDGQSPLRTRDAYVSKNAPKALFSMTQRYFTLSSVNSQAFGLGFFVNTDSLICRLQEKYRHNSKHHHSCTIAAET